MVNAHALPPAAHVGVPVSVPERVPVGSVVRVLDVAGMRRVRSLRGAKTSVVSMQFSSDGRWIVGAVDDGARDAARTAARRPANPRLDDDIRGGDGGGRNEWKE